MIIGANPLVSNGSVTTVADFPGKLKALKRRGGRLTVIDPNRTRTAELADRHIAPRPGTDGALLFAVVNVLFDEDLVDLGVLADQVVGVEQLRALAADFPPGAVAAHCGVEAEEIRALAREIAASATAAVYGRIGTSTGPFGTLTSWLVDVVNLLTGNLDRPGGAMFTKSAIGAAPRPARPGREVPDRALAQPGLAAPRRARNCPPHCWRRRSKPRGGSGPCAVDDRQSGAVRAGRRQAGRGLGHPGLHGVGRPLPQRDLLPRGRGAAPATAVLCRALRHPVVRHRDSSNARYSPPVFELPDGRPDEIEIVCRLVLGLLGLGIDADPGLVDQQIISAVLAKEVADPDSPVAGRSSRS